MPKLTTATKDKYVPAIGRRKTATAQVRIFIHDSLQVTVNGKDFREYFPTAELQKVVESPFTKTEIEPKFKISVVVSGGGTSSQAESVRLGISRALSVHDEEQRTPLKRLGFLKRDPRKVERKKFGLRKARKRVQWRKR